MRVHLLSTKIIFMKRNIGNLFTGMFIISSCVLLSSFSDKKGGDKFEIYVNGRLVMEQFVTTAKTIQTLDLGKNAPNQNIDVYYSHCGKTGTGRSITIRNARNQVLKQWQFADVNSRSAMSCHVKDILALQKNKDANLNLYYSSKELPEGRLLAVIKTSGEKTASVTNGMPGDFVSMIKRSTLPCASLPALN
jgi:hypothetical protein